MNPGASEGHGMDKTELLGTVPATDPWAPAYYHSFGITENYSILFESPERLHLKKIIFKYVNLYDMLDLEKKRSNCHSSSETHNSG